VATDQKLRPLTKTHRRQGGFFLW